MNLQETRLYVLRIAFHPVGVYLYVRLAGREGVSPSLSTTENYEPQEKLLMASLCCGGFVSLDERKRVRGEFSIAEGEGDKISNISRTYFHFLLWLVDGHHPHLRRVSQYNTDMVKRFAGCRGQEAD